MNTQDGPTRYGINYGFDLLTRQERKEVLAELHRLRREGVHIGMSLFCAALRTLEDIHEQLKKRGD